VASAQGSGGGVNPRTTMVLAVVAAALAAFVYFHEIEGEVGRQAARDDANRVQPGLAAEAIDAIELVTQDDVPARFERRDGAWRVVEPVSDRASATALDAIASALADLPKEGRVTVVGEGDASARLSDFGLGDSARVVRFESEGRSLGIRIGRTTPVGGHLYVARLADDEVAYVERFRLNALDRSLADLRERRIFGFESGDVSALRLRWPADEASGLGTPFVEVSVVRDAEGTWQVESPLAGPADDQSVREVLSNLAYLRADGFLDDPTPEVIAALEETALSFAWRVEGEEEEQTARIAGMIGEERVIEAPGDRRYTIAAERLEDFPRRLVDYRFKQISAYEVAAARGLRIELRPESGPSAQASEQPLVVEAALGETGWASEGAELDPDRGSDLVRALSNLSAVDILADEMGEAELASLGLLPPRARIEVLAGEAGDGEGEGGATLAEVRIGRFDPERGLLVMRGDTSTIFQVESGEIDDLPISLEAFEASFVIVEGEDEGENEERESVEEESEDEPPSADPLEGVDLP
jgi:hypothetical protein